MKFKDVNVTEIEEGLIGHGVNRIPVMGAGIAYAIAQHWPLVYRHYRAQIDPVPELGSVDLVVVDEDLIIANCYTQESTGSLPGKPAADMTAVKMCVGKLFSLAKAYNLPLYMPRIGCGLGGLDWNYVEKIILKAEKAHGFECTIIDLPKSTGVLKKAPIPAGIKVPQYKAAAG